MLFNPSCDLQEGIEAAGDHEQEDLQLKSTSGYRVDRLWKEAIQVAESGFNLLPVDLLKVLDGRGNRSG